MNLLQLLIFCSFSYTVGTEFMNLVFFLFFGNKLSKNKKDTLIKNDFKLLTRDNSLYNSTI